MTVTSPSQIQAQQNLQVRIFDAANAAFLTSQGLSPLLAQIYAARGVKTLAEIEPSLDQLLEPQTLKGMDEAVDLLVKSLQNNSKILIVADYDCDGATACAVAVKGLTLLGFSQDNVDYIVPDRSKFGYGLTAELVAAHVLPRMPNVVVTVDNGIASKDGVALARAHGLQVLVTDHHLPGEHLAQPDAMVNPNQAGCEFKSKALAGVGVMFYTLLALRTKLRDAGIGNGNAPLQQLLDLVAVGSVADLVPLDLNNRILVNHGIARIRKGQAQPGVLALLRAAGRSYSQLEIRDIGFAIGPRLNAAGRMADMALGIACLLSEDESQAAQLAQSLNAINDERKQTQSDMLLQATLPSVKPLSHSLTLLDESFHPGVVGLVATRLKDTWLVPTFVMGLAQDNPLEVRGSGRSIAGVHLRDALDLISKSHPDLITRFGGHAMAAGLTMDASKVDQFALALNQAVIDLVGSERPLSTIWVDQLNDPSQLTIELSKQLRWATWGQRFEAPSFQMQAQVISQTLVKEKHLKLKVRLKGQGKAQEFTAMRFFSTENAPANCLIVFSLLTDEFRGVSQLTLNISHIRPQ